MRTERIVSVYILRVVLRSGKRRVTIYDLRSAELLEFDDARKALEHLERLEGSAQSRPHRDP